MPLLLVGMSHEALALAAHLDHPVAAIVDPKISVPTWNGIRVFRDDNEAVSSGDFDAAVIAIDEPAARRRVQSWYASSGLKPFSLVAGPVGPGTEFGDGLFMQRLAHLSADCKLGKGIRLNVGANVMHDCSIGDFTTIAPGAVVLGRVAVGSECYIGTNATIMPDRVIGSGCVVGAGAVVTSDVADGEVVAGVPARCMK